MSAPPSPTQPPVWQQPYAVQLDPDTARRLATHGATILLLDVPEATPIGLDQQVFLTGPRFKGLKMLPPGLHFLSYQARSSRDRVTLSPPVSTFLMLKPGEVVVRRWDPVSEGLVELEEEEAGRYAAGVARFDFDRELAPYDLQRYSQWASLSCHIGSTVLEQLLPPGGGCISVMCEAVDPGLMNPTSAAERRLQQQLEEGRARREAAMQIERPDEQQQQQQPEHAQQPHQQQPPQQQGQVPAQGGRCRYTHLPRVTKVAGATAAQLTALNIDKTSLLTQVMARYQQAAAASAASSGAPQQQQQQQHEHAEGLEVVGELQFAFIAFVFGQSLEGFMQWKQLLVLLLGCVSGPLESHTSLFVDFLVTLTAQLQLGFSVGGGCQAGAAAAAGEDGGAAAAAEGGSGDVGSALLGGGLADELLPDSFLKQAFRGFYEMLQESGAEVPAPLLAQARPLETVLAAGLGWDFRLTELLGGGDSDGDGYGEGGDEFRPTVVELTEQQLAELGLVGC